MDEAYSRMRLFPLYLCPFELFQYHDSTDDYPMTFVLNNDVAGQVQREEFEMAVDGALDRHRLLRCSIEPGKKGRLSWKYRKELPVKIRWQKEGEPLDCPEGVRFHPTEEARIRIWIHQGETEATLTVYFDHVACDGVGAQMFIGDMWAIYSNLVSGPGTAELVDLDPTLLKNRGYRQRYFGTSETEVVNRAVAYKYLFKHGILGCQPLAAPRKSNPSEGEIPLFGIKKRVTTKDEYKVIRDAAVRHGVTVNDLLAAETFMMIRDWNQKYRKPSIGPRRKYKILMPTNLRGRVDQFQPAANMASYNFLARPESDCKDRVSLLKTIREETRDIKNNNLGTEFIEMASRAAHAPWAMKLATKRRRSLGTVVLTNIADPTRRYISKLPRRKGAVLPGNLELLRCYGVPPLRDKTYSVVSISTYLRELTVAIRCDPFLFDEAHTEEMLEIFMDGLKNWADL